MGAWGEGTFQDDQTLDWLNAVVLNPLVRFVEENVSTRDPRRSLEVVAAIDVLVTLYARYEEPPPGVRRVARWRETYLAAWERTDFGSAVPAFLAERRRVIEGTFARLLTYSGSWDVLDDVPADPPS